MKKKTSSQQLYIIFGVVIALLVGLIGYFAYLLMAPSDQPNQTNTNVTAQVTNTNTTINKETKNKKKANTNSNANTNSATSVDEEGLVEPVADGIAEDTETSTEDAEEEETETTDEDGEVVAGEGEQVVTLYFAKTTSDCGEVFPVQRSITPTEDLYGQLILASMAGPTDEEDGYTTAAGSIRLRRVEYTSAGPTIYVDEAYDALSTCDQQTTEAQLVETANAMFDLPEGTTGEVIVGYPDDADGIAENTEEESEDAEEEDETTE